MNHFEAIVLGVGGVGSAALYHLAKRGIRSLGIEQFPLGHDRGSSHGHTRLIRQAYFEHPDYVPLAQRAFALWQELESVSGAQLYHQVGLVQIGPAGGEVLKGVRASAQTHHLPIENLSAAQTEKRFPGLFVPEDCQAVFETRAGYLLVERCVETHAREAVRMGATLHTGQIVRSWQATDRQPSQAGASVVIETDRQRYTADRLIIAAGPWAGGLLSDLGISLRVLRKPLYWFRTLGEAYRADRGFPGFLYDLPSGCYYGFPRIDNPDNTPPINFPPSMKVAEHSGGRPLLGPESIDRDIDAEDFARVSNFVGQYLPSATRQLAHHTPCMYTMSRDEHFILDRHPRWPQVAFAAGLSGHGFKFAGVLGEELARLVCEGSVDPRAKFLALNRESLLKT